MVVGCWLLFVVCYLLFVACCLLYVACESLRSPCEISIFQCASGGGLAHIEAKKIGKSSIRCIFRLENCRLSVSILSIFVESGIAKPLFSSIRRTAFHCKTAGAILFRGGSAVNMRAAVLQSKLHFAYSDRRFSILRCLAKSAPLPRA